MYWQKVLARLSIPGILLLALGAVACTQTPKFCKQQRFVMPVRIAGLVLALLGAVILLDLIPGL